MKRIHGILAGVAGAAVAWMALLGSDLLDETFVLAVSTRIYVCLLHKPNNSICLLPCPAAKDQSASCTVSFSSRPDLAFVSIPLRSSCPSWPSFLTVCSTSG